MSNKNTDQWNENKEEMEEEGLEVPLDRRQPLPHRFQDCARYGDEASPNELARHQVIYPKRILALGIPQKAEGGSRTKGSLRIEAAHHRIVFQGSLGDLAKPAPLPGVIAVHHQEHSPSLGLWLLQEP